MDAFWNVVDRGKKEGDVGYKSRASTARDRCARGRNRPNALPKDSSKKAFAVWSRREEDLKNRKIIRGERSMGGSKKYPGLCGKQENFPR